VTPAGNPSDKQSRAQRTGYVADRMLRSFRVLVTNRDYVFSQFLRSPSRLWKLVVHFMMVLMFANSCINPFIYAAKYRKFPAGRRESNDREN